LVARASSHVQADDRLEPTPSRASARCELITAPSHPDAVQPQRSLRGALVCMRCDVVASGRSGACMKEAARAW
jgi:hypothetical protein